MVDRVIRDIARNVVVSLTPENTINIEYFNPKRRAYKVQLNDKVVSLYAGEPKEFDSSDDLIKSMYSMRGSALHGDTLSIGKYKEDTFAFCKGVILRNGTPIYLAFKDKGTIFIQINVELLSARDAASSFILKKLLPKQIQLYPSTIANIKVINGVSDCSKAMYKPQEMETLLLNGIDTLP